MQLFVEIKFRLKIKSFSLKLCPHHKLFSETGPGPDRSVRPWEAPGPGEGGGKACRVDRPPRCRIRSSPELRVLPSSPRSACREPAAPAPFPTQSWPAPCSWRSSEPSRVRSSWLSVSEEEEVMMTCALVRFSSSSCRSNPTHLLLYTRAHAQTYEHSEFYYKTYEGLIGIDSLQCFKLLFHR